jgi:hypothetical protein
VTVERRRVPEEWPAGPFDLIVLSELAYYFDESDLARLVDVAVASAAGGATLAAVHWRRETDYPLSGDQAHRLIAARLDLRPVARYLEDDFVLEVWSLPA